MECACYGSAMGYLTKIFKEMHISVAEIQQGWISEEHNAYNYAGNIFESKEYKAFLPNFYLMHGKYWLDKIRLPVKKIVIGNPNFSEAKKYIIRQIKRIIKNFDL